MSAKGSVGRTRRKYAGGIFSRISAMANKQWKNGKIGQRTIFLSSPRGGSGVRQKIIPLKYLLRSDLYFMNGICIRRYPEAY
jgi:hypothetical protein